MSKRARYQHGSLTRKARKKGPDVWELRYYTRDAKGGQARRAITLGDCERYRTEREAQHAAAAILLELNSTSAVVRMTPVFGVVIEQFERKEMPERYSTRCSYESMLRRYIRPRWKDTPIVEMKAVLIEQWLKTLRSSNGRPLAPKTLAHIRSLMHLIFECAIRWEIADRNPISRVRVKDCSKRKRRPRIISVAEFGRLVQHLSDPHRTMVIIAMCVGLRASEIVGLKWCDFDFENLSVLVQRSVVHGHEDFVKTEYSNEHLPLDESLLGVLKEWRGKTPLCGDGDWVFGNPDTGRPYAQESIQQDHLRPAGKKIGFGDGLGWHTFRHTYRTLLGHTGAEMSVQKELMRHANIQTTMNVYGKALDASKRAASGKVVQMVLASGSSDLAQASC